MVKDDRNKYDSNGRLIRYTFEDGSQTAANGWMDAQLSSITSSDKFLDCAYVYIQMVKHFINWILGWVWLWSMLPFPCVDNLHRKAQPV